MNNREGILKPFEQNKDFMEERILHGIENNRPIALLTAGLLAMAFMGFSGVV